MTSPRPVTITLEVLSTLPLSLLRDKKYWASSAVEVKQVQVNVIKSRKKK